MLINLVNVPAAMRLGGIQAERAAWLAAQPDGRTLNQSQISKIMSFSYMFLDDDIQKDSKLGA